VSAVGGGRGARGGVATPGVGAVGRGLGRGYLGREEVAAVVREGVAGLDLEGLRVLCLVPDGTRTMPMPLLFDLLERELGPRVRALDYLVALGTHPAMSDAQLGRLVGREVKDGRAGSRLVLNHRWSDPDAFTHLGTIPAAEIAELSGGRLRQDVPVALNRLVRDYDALLVCGPVFPHEVAGFSGGTKYLFPGVAGREIIDFTHWLGALVTSLETIGRRDTPVRAVIDRAAGLVDRPLSLLALVGDHGGTAGLFCGPMRETWERAVALSARRHVAWVERPFRRILAVMPEMYEDLWTAAKGMYKAEPALEDGGEVVIYAPHVREVSHTHGRLLEEVGYHCRDYFLGQWERFRSYPGGVLAHSTHLRGQGTYDPATGVETSRVRVTLATGISRERCERIGLGYLDPASVDVARWEGREDEGVLVIPRAGERLFRVGRPPDPGD
jgi:nickel-dependent lactate racemase